MNDKFKGLITGIAVLIELGCISSLAVIALKRNRDCYEAECNLLEAESKLIYKELEVIHLNHEISMLKYDLNELKGKQEEES